MSRKTHYVVLGIAPGEGPAGVRAAYRELARRHHPDVSGEGGTRAFQDIAEAYRVLSDPQLRREYDARLEREPPARRPPASADDTSARQVSAAPPFGAEPLAPISDPGAMRVAEFDLLLTPDEARSGGVVRFAVPATFTCARCSGSGYDWLFLCTACGGDGVLRVEPVVAVAIDPMPPPGMLLEIPLDAPGVHRLLIRLHVSVGR
jgi:DnaJ-class molecular chaperone